MAEYVVKGAEPNETVLHTWTPNGYEAWHWLPVHERIVRCRDCKHFTRDATPHDAAFPDWCSKLGTDYVQPDGFCAWGERGNE